MSRQLSLIKEKSKVVYQFAVLYFPGKFSCNKQLSHVDTAGLSVVTKDHVSQGARDGFEFRGKGIPTSPSMLPNITHYILSEKWLWVLFSL